jgi:hypothetical protein
MFTILGLYAALSVVLLFYVLRLTGSGPTNAALLTGIVVVSFGWLSVFSIPESYSLATVGLMLAVISGHKLAHATSRSLWPRILLHGIVSGIAAWVYLPNCGAALFACGQGEVGGRLRRALIISSSAGVAACVAVAPQLLYNGFGNIAAQIQYGRRWGDVGHFTDPVLWFNVLSGFFWFSVVSPVTDVMRSPGGIDWSTLLLTRPAAVAFAAYLCGVYAAAVVLLRKSSAAAALRGPVVWLLLLVAWNVYFNPGEILLYLSAPLGILAYLVGFALRDVEKTSPRRLTVLLSLTFLAVLALNWRPIFG